MPKMNDIQQNTVSKAVAEQTNKSRLFVAPPEIKSKVLIRIYEKPNENQSNQETLERLSGVVCQACPKAVWQVTNKSDNTLVLSCFCSKTYRDSFSELTGFRTYACDGLYDEPPKKPD